MLKKLAVFILVVMCLLPSVCFADDAAIPDDKNRLTAEISFDSLEAKIGGTFDFTITMTNNTSNIISYLQIYRVFSNCYLTDSIKKQFGSGANHELAPYETVVWDVSANINSQVNWYKNGNEFYTDFELILEYTAFEYNDAFEEVEEGYFYFTTGVIPIKLTNLNDGSELISFKEKANVDPLYFVEYKYEDIGDCGLEGSLSTEVYIYNSSKSTIENFNILGEKDDTVSDIINPDEFLTYIVNSFYETYREKYPSHLKYTIKTIFNIEGKYYAACYDRSYQIIPIHLPRLDLTISPNEEQPSNYDFVVKNTSNNDYIDLYLDLHNNEELCVQNLIILEKNQEYIETLPTSNLPYVPVKIGILHDNKIFHWTVYYLYTDDNKIEELSEILICDPKDFIDGEFIQGLPELLPTTASPTPTPTTTDVYAKPYVPPTTTPIPTPAPSPTASTAPAIVINSITKKPPVPYWVWIVLGFALVGTGIVLYVLGVRRSKKERD